MSLEQTGAMFSTTCWGIVESLRSGDEALRLRCLDALVTRYWPPVYGYLRRAGLDRESASETTQAFFADVVLQRGLFERASQGRGRLRSLIIEALRNYRIDLSRRAAARGVTKRISMDLDAVELQLQAVSTPPEREFERRWASSLLSEALRRTQDHFVQTGKGRHWKLFEARVLQTAAPGPSPRPLNEVAPEEGFAKPADGAAAVQVVKKWVHTVLEQVVAETVADGKDVAGELAAVHAALSGAC